MLEPIALAGLAFCVAFLVALIVLIVRDWFRRR